MQNDLSVKIREIIAGHFGVDPICLTEEARFRDDLGGDWLDRLEVLITIEEQISGFEIADVVADQIETVGDLMRVIEGRDLTVALKSQAQAPALTAKISTRNPSD
jgi:acyl carrier protein